MLTPSSAAVAAQHLSRLSSPLSSKEPQLSTTTTPTCNPHTCSWRPYSNSNDFEANAVMVLIILFCALICALAINVAIRCFLRGQGSGSQRSSDRLPRTLQELEQRKPANEAATVSLAAAPTLVFSEGLKLAGAEAECAICLSEFVGGEGIQVLGRCNHGFHAQCIEQWLSSHTSCPTCRCSTLSSSPSQEENTAQRIGRHPQAVELGREP